MGTLFVVATPIGNLEDLSPRAERVLREVALIAAEDTRHTGRLLARFGIATPQISYHAFNERARQERLLAALAGGDVALVTDAGTPAISDPGTALVDAALESGFPVRAVPGPSAVTAAASVSGLLAGPYTFLGFLPRDATERAALVGKAAAVGFGVVLFEAPGRLPATLGLLAAPFAGRRYAVVREISKIHETVTRARFAPGETVAEIDARGEIVVVIEGGAAATEEVDPRALLARLLGGGMKPSEAAREASVLTGRARADLYAIATELRKESEA